MPDETRLKRYTTLAAAADMLVEKRLALLNPAKWQDTNDTYFLSVFQEMVGANGIYAACFTQAAETYHHWQVFAGDNEGVCVEFDREALLGFLMDASASYRWGDMKYRTLAQVDVRKRINVYELPFLKRKGFADEKEFRLLFHSRSAQQPVHYIDIERTWVKRIIFNPWISEPLFQSLKTTLQTTPGCSNVAIVRTSLIDNVKWKSACDRVEELPRVKKPPPRSIW